MNSAQRIRRAIMLLLILLLIIIPCTPVYATSDTLGADEDTIGQTVYPPPELGEYIQIGYNDTNGLPTSEANAILYSSDGYIWIGSYSGLTRYDSYRFTTYGSMASSILKGIGIRTLFEDSSGRVWIGSNDSGLFCWEDGSFSSIDIDSGNVSRCIRDITETAEGDIAIATTAGLAIIDGNSLEARPINIEALEGAPAEAVLCDRHGHLWAIIDSDVVCFSPDQSNNSIIFRLSGIWTDFAQHSSELNCLFETPDGEILIGTAGASLIRLTPDDNGGYISSTISTGKCDTINCIFLDSYRRIWLCSDTGIGYLSGDSVVYASATRCSSSIVDMTEDYEGNLWFASSREGIMELSRGKFTSTNATSNLTNATINATLLFDGCLYAATDSGLVVLDGTSFKPIDHILTKLLDGIRIRSIMADSSGSLWICTYKDFGIIRYKDGDFVSIDSDDGLPSEKVRIAYELSDGSIAVATNGGVAVIKDDKVTKTYTEKDGFVNPVILCLTQDALGNLYCGSDGNGLYVVSPEGEVGNLTTNDGLPTDVVLNTVYDARNQCIWISCGSNLAILDSEGIRPLPYYKGGSGSIFDIKLLEDEAWILATTSVTIAPYEHMLNGTGECVVLTKDDGLFELTSNSRHYLSEDRVLYIATGNGVVTIDTLNIYANTTVPKAIINSITIDHQTVISNPSGTITLDADADNISIEFSALSYVPGSYQIEFQLVGMDDEPMTGNASEIHTRDYTNLRAGTYEFRLSVISPSGVRSEQDISLKIKKTPSFFERPLVIIALILAGAILIAAAFEFYLKRKTELLRSRQERYRSITEAALRTIAKTIDAKDSYTNGHSYRVAQYSRELAERMGWDGDELENLYYTALVHDIGKIGIPDSILTKKGRLTPEEYRIIQQHPNIGYEILKDFTDIPNVSIGAKYHHERYDGTGYTEGLSGQDIPLVSRIIAVADAYDAMSTPRVYRDALSTEEIIRELTEGSGSQFDPEIAQIMLDLISEGIGIDAE